MVTISVSVAHFERLNQLTFPPRIISLLSPLLSSSNYPAARLPLALSPLHYSPFNEQLILVRWPLAGYLRKVARIDHRWRHWWKGEQNTSFSQNIFLLKSVCLTLQVASYNMETLRLFSTWILTFSGIDQVQQMNSSNGCFLFHSIGNNEGCARNSSDFTRIVNWICRVQSFLASGVSDQGLLYTICTVR